jgi:hypothetical protein
MTEVVDEFVRRRLVTAAEARAGNELRIRLDRHEGPDVANAEVIAQLGRNVLRLHAYETPNLVALDAFAIESGQPSVLQIVARFADAFEQGKDGHLRRTGHPAGRSDGATLDESGEYRGTLSSAQLVHGKGILCLSGLERQERRASLFRQER